VGKLRKKKKKEMRGKRMEGEDEEEACFSLEVLVESKQLRFVFSSHKEAT
jgi:hypothetical protein